LIISFVVMATSMLAKNALVAADGSDRLHSVDAPPLTEGGVVVSFDDRNFDDWVKAIPLFDQYGVKATFFISGKIDATAIAAIRKLQSHGHCIGSHSVNHLRAVDYCEQHSTDEFLENEILPQLMAFREAGVTPTSFAYPMSDNNGATDKALRSEFRHIRTGRNLGKSERLNEVEQFFVPVTDIADGKHFCLYAKGIDHAPERPDRTFAQIDAAMARAAQRKEIIVFYAHRISGAGTSNFIRPAALARIFARANELQLKFYTFDELP
jgi:peptidoglycan/xylan/chitin deacetylase (PgdA/CDA1 family)